MSESLISMQLIEDGAVPPARLGEYVRGVRDILARHGFTGVLFGHAGDGHLHANVLVDVEAPHWKERLGDVFDATVSLTIGLGGTLSGEHGDGRLRAQANARVWPAGAGERFRRVKETFDPEGLLNPGVKLTDDASTPLGAPVKYDPALQPLPAAARRALDRVQRERAWRRPRIELLEEERGR